MTQATRILVAIGYGTVTYIILNTISAVHPGLRPARWFLAFATFAWCVWYSYLAVTGPEFSEPWLVLRNVLHIPLLAAVGLNIWAVSRVR